VRGEGNNCPFRTKRIAEKFVSEEEKNGESTIKTFAELE
jgi:hypothetical protein